MRRFTFLPRLASVLTLSCFALTLARYHLVFFVRQGACHAKTLPSFERRRGTCCRRTHRRGTSRTRIPADQRRSGGLAKTSRARTARHGGDGRRARFASRGGNSEARRECRGCGG